MGDRGGYLANTGPRNISGILPKRRSPVLLAPVGIRALNRGQRNHFPRHKKHDALRWEGRIRYIHHLQTGLTRIGGGHRGA